MKQVDLIGIHIEATSGAPVVLLRENDEPHRVLPIFVGAPEATAIVLALSGQVPPRPLTHDLMAALVQTFDGHVEAVEVTEMRDGTFLAELALAGPTGHTKVDSRPSDAIALAVRVGAPVLVDDAVLEIAGMTFKSEPQIADDERAIDEAVGEFRRLLDGFDPAELAAALGETGTSPPPSESSGLGTDDPDDGRP